MKNAASNAGGAVASAAHSILAPKKFSSLANPGKYTPSESAAALTAKAAGNIAKHAGEGVCQWVKRRASTPVCIPTQAFNSAAQ